jgi:hypothetical protein
LVVVLRSTILLSVAHLLRPHVLSMEASIRR